MEWNSGIGWVRCVVGSLACLMVTEPTGLRAAEAFSWKTGDGRFSEASQWTVGNPDLQAAPPESTASVPPRDGDAAFFFDGGYEVILDAPANLSLTDYIVSALPPVVAPVLTLVVETNVTMGMMTGYQMYLTGGGRLRALPLLVDVPVLESGGLVGVDLEGPTLVVEGFRGRGNLVNPAARIRSGKVESSGEVTVTPVVMMGGLWQHTGMGLEVEDFRMTGARLESGWFRGAMRMSGGSVGQVTDFGSNFTEVQGNSRLTAGRTLLENGQGFRVDESEWEAGELTLRSSRLVVVNGSRMTANTVRLESESRWEVDGLGSSLTSGLIRLGQVMIRSGATGVVSGALDARLSVTSPGSEFRWLEGWDRGVVSVTDGARVVGGNFSGPTSGSGVMMEVRGAGSALELSGALILAGDTVQPQRVVVGEGGRLRSGPAQVGQADRRVTVTVDGVSSEWRVGSELALGAGGVVALVGGGGVVLEAEEGEARLQGSYPARIELSGGGVVIGGTNRAPAGQMQVLDGWLEGGGDIRGDVVVGAEGGIRGGVDEQFTDRWVVSGELTLSAGSRVELDIAGVGVEVVDALEVGGAVKVAGQLRLAFGAGFSPRKGDTFELIRYAGAWEGDWDTVTVVGVAEAFAYQLEELAPGSYGLRALTNGDGSGDVELSWGKVEGSEWQVSWPEGLTGYRLEGTTNVVTGPWVEVPGEGNRRVIPLVRPEEYFRLIR